MTLTDLVLDLDHSRRLQSVLDAKGIKMKTAFSWRVYSLELWMPEPTNSEFVGDGYYFPAPTLEELLAFLKKNYPRKDIVLTAPYGYPTWICDCGENGADWGFEDTDPKLAACELIIRMTAVEVPDVDDKS